MRLGRGHIVFFCFLSIFGLFGTYLPVKAAPRFEVSIFYPGAAYNPSLISGLASQLNVQFTSAKWYQDWGTSFDSSIAQRFATAGYIPELTWEPQVSGAGVSYDAVVSGGYDAYITEMAQAVKGVGSTVRISLAPEMNTDWTPWGIGKQGNNRDNHKLFWRHVVQKFRDVGTNNVKWIWSANVRPWNAGTLYGTYADIFPGSDYVDYMGLDGYNWGTSQSWSSWQTFSEVFASSYNELANVSAKNILIMEMASAEAGGSKAAWIADLFSQLKGGYSRIVGFTWFHINKETDWRITSSAEAAASFTAGYNGTSGGQTSSNNTNNNSPAAKPASNPQTKTTTQPQAAPPATETSVGTEVAEEIVVESTEPLPEKVAGSIANNTIVKGLNRAIQENVAMAVAFIFGGAIVLYIFRSRLGHFHLLGQKSAFINFFAGFGHLDTIHHARKFRHLHARQRAKEKRRHA